MRIQDSQFIDLNNPHDVTWTFMYYLHLPKVKHLKV